MLGILLSLQCIIENGFVSLLAALAHPWPYVLKIILKPAVLAVPPTMNKICSVCILLSLRLWLCPWPLAGCLGPLAGKMLRGEVVPALTVCAGLQCAAALLLFSMSQASVKCFPSLVQMDILAGERGKENCWNPLLLVVHADDASSQGHV